MNACYEWLQTHNIVVPKDWVEACLDWIKQEHTVTSIKELHYKVYQQWLVANLKDFEAGQLPKEVSDPKFVLKKNICLQIESIKDIAEPAYAQLLEIKKCDNPNNYVSAETQFNTNNTQSSVKQNRMLMIGLTDGVKTIQGIECKFIKDLSVNTPPGSKIRIKAPVTSRMGVIMLKPSNIDFLGGEVDDILQINCYENMLCYSLGLSLNEIQPMQRNQTPLLDVTAQATVLQTPNFNQNQAIEQNDIPIDILDELINEDDFAEQDINVEPPHHTRNINPSENVTLPKGNADSLNRPKDVRPTENANMNSYIDCIMDDLDDDFELKSLSSSNNVSELTNNSSGTGTECSHTTVTAEENLKYLCQISETDLCKFNPCQITTKAVVITLCSKLKFTETDGWGIDAKICDGTKTVSATFSNNVIFKLIKWDNASNLSKMQHHQTVICKDALINMYQTMVIDVNLHEGTFKYTVTDLK